MNESFVNWVQSAFNNVKLFKVLLLYFSYNIGENHFTPSASVNYSSISSIPFSFPCDLTSFPSSPPPPNSLYHPTAQIAFCRSQFISQHNLGIWEKLEHMGETHMILGRISKLQRQHLKSHFMWNTGAAWQWLIKEKKNKANNTKILIISKMSHYSFAPFPPNIPALLHIFSYFPWTTAFCSFLEV